MEPKRTCDCGASWRSIKQIRRSVWRLNQRHLRRNHGTRLPASESFLGESYRFVQIYVTGKNQGRMVWLPVSTIEVLQAAARDRLDGCFVTSHLATERMIFAEQDSAKNLASYVRRTIAFLQNSIQPLPPLPLQFLFRKRGFKTKSAITSSDGRRYFLSVSRLAWDTSDSAEVPSDVPSRSSSA